MLFADTWNGMAMKKVPTTQHLSPGCSYHGFFIWTPPAQCCWAQLTRKGLIWRRRVAEMGACCQLKPRSPSRKGWRIWRKLTQAHGQRWHCWLMVGRGEHGPCGQPAPKTGPCLTCPDHGAQAEEEAVTVQRLLQKGDASAEERRKGRLIETEH